MIAKVGHNGFNSYLSIGEYSGWSWFEEQHAFMTLLQGINNQGLENHPPILSHAVQLKTVQFSSRNSWKQPKIAL